MSCVGLQMDLHRDVVARVADIGSDHQDLKGLRVQPG